MAGFRDGRILVAENVDFSGANPPTDTVTADGQLLIGSTASPNIRVGALASSGGSVTITVGSGTINLEAGAATPTQFDTDSGSAVPALNILEILGGTGVDTSGAGNTVTVDAGADVATTYDGDTGSATPALNVLTIAGGTLLSTTGAGSTMTVDADAEVAASFPTDSGTATPAVNALTIAGGTGVATSGAGATVTIDASASTPLSFPTDSGTATPAANALTIAGGTNCSTSGSGATVTIDVSSGGISSWVEVTGTSQAMAVNTGYIANNASEVVFTLPSTAPLGSVLRVVGKGAGGWTIEQNASQTQHYLGSSTTTGVGGDITAVEDLAAIELVATTADTDFTALSSLGNFTIT